MARDVEESAETSVTWDSNVESVSRRREKSTMSNLIHRPSKKRTLDLATER